MAVLYLCDTYPLREEPDKDAAVTAELDCGTTLCLKSAVYKDGDLWF